jgi:hypothetical protein
MHVTNDIPLGCSLFLPVGTVNSVQTQEGYGEGDDGEDEDSFGGDGVLFGADCTDADLQGDEEEEESADEQENEAAAAAAAVAAAALVVLLDERLAGYSTALSTGTEKQIAARFVVRSEQRVYGVFFFRQDFALEDSIEFHAFAPLEAMPCV